MTNDSAVIEPGLDGLDDIETAFLILEAIVLVPTVFGNSLIILSVYRFPWLQTPLHALVVNLAFTELLVGVVLIPLDVTGTFFGLNSYKYVCLVQLATMLALLCSSLLSMLAISMERCFSVTFPHKHRMASMKTYVTIFIIAAWVFVVSLSAVPVLGWNTFSNRRKCNHIAVWPVNYRYLSNALIFTVVIAKVFFFSITARIALKKMTRYNDNADRKMMKRRMAKLYALIFISAVFIICWAPYCIVSFTKLFLSYMSLTTIHSWTLLLGFCNAALNWLIYGLKNYKIRKAFKIILTGKKEENIPQTNSSS